jgi:hypothetical protein
MAITLPIELHFSEGKLRLNIYFKSVCNCQIEGLQNHDCRIALLPQQSQEERPHIGDSNRLNSIQCKKKSNISMKQQEEDSVMMLVAECTQRYRPDTCEQSKCIVEHSA